MIGTSRRIEGEKWSYVIATPDKEEADEKAAEMREIQYTKCRVTHESDGRYYVWVPVAVTRRKNASNSGRYR